MPLNINSKVRFSEERRLFSTLVLCVLILTHLQTKIERSSRLGGWGCAAVKALWVMQLRKR